MSEVNENIDKPALTFGEKLVGKSFNPSADPRVDRLKALAAEMADIVNEHNGKLLLGLTLSPQEAISVGEDAYLNSTFKGGAIRRILTAQMWAVKHITNK